MPFNKEELNTILKFGAEELFKEGDDEDEVQVGKKLKYVNSGGFREGLGVPCHAPPRLPAIQNPSHLC